MRRLPRPDLQTTSLFLLAGILLATMIYVEFTRPPQPPITEVAYDKITGNLKNGVRYQIERAGPGLTYEFWLFVPEPPREAESWFFGWYLVGPAGDTIYTIIPGQRAYNWGWYGGTRDLAPYAGQVVSTLVDYEATDQETDTPVVEETAFINFLVQSLAQTGG